MSSKVTKVWHGADCQGPPDAIAVDENSASFEAYGITSIPHAFVIDTAGAVAWRGHPDNAGLEQTLEDLHKVMPDMLAPFYARYVGQVQREADTLVSAALGTIFGGL